MEVGAHFRFDRVGLVGIEGLTEIQELDKGMEALIDEDMLRAILAVPHYEHGTRSLKMLLQLCSRSERRNARAAQRDAA
jgi:hypothetical protein